MDSIIFHSKEFEMRGARVPEFKLQAGNLIRIYVPNFGNEHLPLGYDLAIELAKRFQDQNTDILWAKNYRKSSLYEFIIPLTVKSYLLNKMKIDLATANRIVSEVGVKLSDRFERLDFTNQKALIVKANFEKSNSILLDYYRVEAMGIEFLESVVNSEIEKGKAAIAFDRLEYVVEHEP
ncbi:MAG: hypothetical protein AAF944_28930 [Bacteroidota bacterium]